MPGFFAKSRWWRSWPRRWTASCRERSCSSRWSRRSFWTSPCTSGRATTKPRASSRTPASPARCSVATTSTATCVCCCFFRGGRGGLGIIFFFFVRACINDVWKIKIGKNQNQNWVLIGRGSKPPDYASLFFGNRCLTKEVPRDLMFIFRKITLNVYFSENKHWRCSPDRRLSECYTPEARAQQSYNSST